VRGARPIDARRSELTREAFEAFLLRLDPRGRDRAGEKYELLKQKLRLFFRQRLWSRGDVCIDVCVDETLDRVARNVAAGEKIAHLNAYVSAVARNVLYEAIRSPQTTEVDPDSSHPATAEQEEDLTHNRMMECLEGCLSELPRSGRTALLDWYREKGRKKKAIHQRIRDRFRTSASGARTRVFRTKLVLRRCVEDCLNEDQGQEKRTPLSFH
jgi:DNA-directed RNA polymerase specialized sigma24 family protein